MNWTSTDKLVKMSMLKAKEHWVTDQCNDVEWNLKPNYTEKSHQVVRDVTSRNKQGRLKFILNKTVIV